MTAPTGSLRIFWLSQKDIAILNNSKGKPLSRADDISLLVPTENSIQPVLDTVAPILQKKNFPSKLTLQKLVMLYSNL